MQDFVKQKKNIHKKLKIAALRSAKRQSQKIRFKNVKQSYSHASWRVFSSRSCDKCNTR